MYDFAEVSEHIKEYMKRNLPNYELVGVRRASSFTEDFYLYMVIAKKKVNPYREMGFGDYACWTCWNESTQCLNGGHYDITNETTAHEILNEYYR